MSSHLSGNHSLNGGSLAHGLSVEVLCPALLFADTTYRPILLLLANFSNHRVQIHHDEHMLHLHYVRHVHPRLVSDLCNQFSTGLFVA